MTFTIELGWWLIPATMSLALAIFAMKPLPPAYGYGNIGDGLVEAVQILAGTVVVLAAWFIWALAA